MDRLILAFGSKEFVTEDIHFLARKWTETPRVVTATNATAKEVVIEKASSLFGEPDLVVALVDPSKDVLERIMDPLSMLKEKAYVIIYSTSADLDVPKEIGAVRVTVEQEKEKRFREKVLAAVRADGKKMTDKAYSLLKERILDESVLESEMAKLIGYVGDKNVIDTKDVAAVVSERHEEDFITLSEAMARKDKKQLMLIVDTLLSQGMNLLAIQGFLSKQIRLLLQARDAEEFFAGASDFRSFSKEFGGLKSTLDPTPLDKKQFLAFQKPYYAYNLSKTSRKFSEEFLVSFLHVLADFDCKVKRGTRFDRTNFEEGLLGVS
jgi:DNA polymerase III delta subunit